MLTKPYGKIPTDGTKPVSFHLERKAYTAHKVSSCFPLLRFAASLLQGNASTTSLQLAGGQLAKTVFNF